MNRGRGVFFILLVKLYSTVIFLAITAGTVFAQGTCSCTNCPQFMPDGFQGNFYIQVQSASNPTLGQNGQGVCGVTLNFEHEYVGDLTITLTSPAGQSVTFLNPIGLFGETDGTTWDISFVPCSEPASPDPGFTDVWSNNQNWGIFGFYTGAYYPQSGCLEDFNTGPVNGQWNLSVTDGQNNDVGNFYNYSIIFCDPTGIECTSCEANAGNLLQPDITACAGDISLQLDLPPTYVAPQVPPPAGSYSYTYIIANGGIIVAYEAGPDLSAYSTGTYTVCGLSYLTSDAPDIPSPNGSLTISQLAAQLTSAAPPFCGKITSNCVNVNILPALPNIEDTATICAPDCYEYYGELFCTTGDYPVTVQQNGCSFTATLHLKVFPKSTKTVFETICPGTCAKTPGFENYCAAGTYTLTFEGANGCDSLVTLNLNVLEVDAVIMPPPPLSCGQTEIVLQSSGSSTGTGLSYQWTATNGGTFVGPIDQDSATVGSAGQYILVLCKTGGGASCCDTASVVLEASQDPPSLPATPSGPQMVCAGETASWSIDSIAGITAYHWTAPATVEIISGQNSPEITLFWNSDSSGMVCVQTENTCGLSPSNCLNVFIQDSLPAPDSLLAASVVCVGDTAVYVVLNTTGAASFLWKFPADALVLGGLNNDTAVVLWQTGGSAEVCVQSVNNCDTSTAICTDVQRIQAPTAPAVTGPDTICAGQIDFYQILPGPSVDAFTWDVAGGKILNNPNSTDLRVQWSGQPGNGRVCVQLENACGISPESCLDVFIRPVDQANAGPDSAVCGLKYKLTAAGVGHWSLVFGPGAVVFSDSLSSNTEVAVTKEGLYLFEWQNDFAICPQSDSVQIQFFPDLLAGTDSVVCDAANEFYQIYIPLLGGVAPFTANGTPVIGNTFVSDSFPSGGVFQFVFADANGCTLAVVDSFTCACSSSAGQMNPDIIKICSGQFAISQHIGGAVLDGNDTSIYILHTNAGTDLGQILDQNTIGIFGFQPGMHYDSVYYISLVVGNNLNGSPDLLDPCLSIAEGQPVVFLDRPATNAGPDTASCGSQIMLNASPADGYWSTISSPANVAYALLSDSLNPQTILKTNTPGFYALSWTTEHNGCIDSDTVNIIFHETPIVANLQQVCDSVNENYIVKFNISGGAPPYSINTGLISGDLFESTWLPNGNNYTFLVSDLNNCTAPVINGSFACNCSSAAGSMPATLVSACAGDSIRVLSNGNYHLDNNDTLVYLLHTKPGDKLGQVIELNHSGIFHFLPGMYPDSVYYISLVVGNTVNGVPDLSDPCLSIAPGQPIVFLQAPLADAGISSNHCGLNTLLDASPTGGAGVWTQEKGPGSALIDQAASPNSPVTASIPGVYVFRWTVSNGLCSASDTVSIVFFEIPVIDQLEEICLPTNTAYSVAFTLSGGLPPYIVDGLGGALNGLAFLSTLLPNNSSYLFSITDANGCKTPEVAGMHGCACVTSAGTMESNPGLFCTDQPAVAQWNNDAKLDGDDLVRFILHDKPNAALGNILAENIQPMFSFEPNLQPGTIYYISAIAGNNIAGKVDLTDPCLSVAPGRPVAWKPLPVAFMTGDTTVCAGQEANLHFRGSGTFPLTLIYKDDSGIMNTITLNNSQEMSLPVVPAVSTSYTLVTIIDGGQIGCSQNSDDSVDITVQKATSAGTAIPHPEYCQGNAPLLHLADLIAGEDSGGTWEIFAPHPVDPSVWNAASARLNAGDLPSGGYGFQYRVSGQPACPDDSTALVIFIRPNPDASAGPDAILDCTTPEVLLTGHDSSQEAGIVYQWQMDGIPLSTGDSANVWVNQPGQYTLLVTNKFGCTASDTAKVTHSGIPLEDLWVQIKPIRCFGEKNAALWVDSVLGGTPPILFSLNGSPFRATRIFDQLPPGNFELVAQDAAGCEWSEIFQIVEPAEIKIDLGPDIEAALGDSVYLWLQSSLPTTSLDTVIWQPLLDSNSTGKPYQHFLPVHSGKVVAMVTDSNGCVAEDVIILTLSRNRRVYLPNIFCPESDQNGRFKIGVGNDVEKVKVLEIYDRWGEKVYEARNFSPLDSPVGWDGTFRGQKMPPGVYACFLYIQFKDGESEIFTSSLTLLR